jgi:hypothetical protein
MTLTELIEQCYARGYAWQLSGGMSPNGIPFTTATIAVPESKPPIMAMRTRSGMPVESAVLALEDALTEVTGRQAVRGYGKGKND